MLIWKLHQKIFGDYTKINDMITEKAKDAGMTGKLSGWAMPSQVYTPQFQVELAKYMHDNNLKPEDVRSVEFLNKFLERTYGSCS